MRDSMRHVVLSLGTLAVGTLGAFVAASCASHDTPGEKAGRDSAAATVTGVIVRPPPTFTVDPCFNKSCTSDGLYCTRDCSAGACGYTTITCNDNNVCTDDSCNETADRCVNTPNAAPCTDNDVCTLEDRCAAGACAPGAARLACDDGNPCTTDSCDPVSGCKFTPRPDGTNCDDGSSCTASSQCSGGACVGTAQNGCVDENPCTTETCGGNMCMHVPAVNQACGEDKCLNGQACDEQGTCSGGEPVTCDDGNPCTDDGCDPATGCVFTPNEAECDDGDACTEGDHCEDGECASDSGIECSAIDDCHEAGACDTQTGICSDPRKPDGETCENTGTCTGGRCVGGTPDPVGAGGEASEPGDAGASSGGRGGSGRGGSAGDGDRGDDFEREPGGCAVASGTRGAPLDLTALLGGALGLSLLAGRRRRTR